VAPLRGAREELRAASFEHQAVWEYGRRDLGADAEEVSAVLPVLDDPERRA